MPEPKVHQDTQHKQEHTDKADSRLREEQGEKRSGSDSNAHNGRKGSRLHENHKDQNDLLYKHPDPDANFARDLNPHDQAGANHGQNQAMLSGARSAEELKELHTRLADLTDDELKNIVVLPAGTHLEQGAKYIDLRHLEQGEFVAMSNMVATPENYYVPKKETDYVLWNRLNQVDNPARLDENENAG